VWDKPGKEKKKKLKGDISKKAGPNDKIDGGSSSGLWSQVEKTVA